MEKISSGKVREIYNIDDDKLMLVTSDRISAFDNIMPSLIDDKGIILTQISLFWFDYIDDIIKNHIITSEFEKFPIEFRKEEFKQRSMLVKKLKMLPIECIVRGYITGSGFSEYQKSGTICGQILSPSLRESEKLEEPIFTPSTKAELGDHDELISFDKCVQILGYDLAHEVRKVSIEIYKKCASYAYELGIIIADTKFEFGLDENNNLVIADEILTPDSSRFWPVSDYEVGKVQKSFDKQYLRDWLSNNGYRTSPPESLPEDIINTTRDKYIEAYEKITNKPFVKQKKR